MPDLFENTGKIPAGLVNRDAPQSVVAAEGEDDNCDRPAEDPVDPPQPGGGGFAAETGVDHGVPQAGGPQFLLNQRWIGLLRFNTVACGQAVAKEEDGRLRFVAPQKRAKSEDGADREESGKHDCHSGKVRFDPVSILCQQKMSSILKVEGVTKVYRSAGRDLVVLDDIGFEVSSGASCAVVGPSGSGKSTLLGICAGLDEPSAGSVRLDGIALHGLSEDGRAALRNRAVGFVFQSFHLIPTLTALENVMVPLELRGERGVAGRARELLGEVGLGDRCGPFPVQLSGGEQQRVALARAFINRPRILFADEPTGNLDGETAERVTELLFRLNAESGTTLILVTHDIELAGRTDRTIRLRGGRMVSGRDGDSPA